MVLRMNIIIWSKQPDCGSHPSGHQAEENVCYLFCLGEEISNQETQRFIEMYISLQVLGEGKIKQNKLGMSSQIRRQLY